MAMIYGIGMGPGDPELLTIKGFNILRNCPIIAYPTPPNQPSFVRQIASHWLDTMPTKQEITIPIPLDLNHRDSRIYETAVCAIIDAVTQSANPKMANVAILCEGDPFLYGSFMYLFQELSARIETTPTLDAIEIIPGISSVMACAARISQPLAEKSEPLLILPALKIDDHFQQHLQKFPAIAIMKIGKRFLDLKNLLARLDLIQHAFYIEYATLDKEKIMPLLATDFTDAPYFSMIIVRKTKS